jgi:hypothetical protein
MISMNARRDITMGQRAIWAAKAVPYGRGGPGRGKKNSKLEIFFPMVTPSRLSEARVILEFAPDLANQVLRGGSIPFSAAYEQASQRKAEAESNEEKEARLLKEAPDLADLAGMSLQAALDKLEQRKADAAKLAMIEEDAPDLVALVKEARMSVADALAAAHAREEEKRAAQEGATSLLAQVVRLIGVESVAPKERAARLMEDVNPDMWPQGDLAFFSSEFLKACSDMLAECAKILRSREK